MKLLNLIHDWVFGKLTKVTERQWLYVEWIIGLITLTIIFLIRI